MKKVKSPNIIYYISNAPYHVIEQRVKEISATKIRENRIEIFLKNQLRSVIFNQVLQRSTLPRESSHLFRLSFYDVMIRPLLRTIDRDFNNIGNQDQTSFLKDTMRPAFLKWIEIEEKQPQKFQNMVIRVQKER